MSGGVVLFTCGHPDHRYIGPNATLMIHSASGGSEGTMEEVRSNTNELERLYYIYLDRMSKNCKKKKGFFNKKIKENGPEWFIDAKEAKKIGIASHIGIPVLETDILVQHELRLK
jgi:ATP-dependent protease ClpP protease subunit